MYVLAVVETEQWHIQLPTWSPFDDFLQEEIITKASNIAVIPSSNTFFIISIFKNNADQQRIKVRNYSFEA